MSRPFRRDVPVRPGLLTAQGSVALFGDRRAAGLPVVTQVLDDEDLGLWNASTNEWIGAVDVNTIHGAVRPVASGSWSGEGTVSHKKRDN